ncbi:hypothetical protein ACFOHT_17950 [Massilia oculi]|uniref:Uncharacterized protein n=1 Tax=Massilia oculi TaxID=945844 RepID=A0A2S2DJU4_9BURK|nr:hypothetical protein [Massilia oculi]AWL05632.1 hypothetical protein DIR46_15195 [Massilia oculi]
MESRSDPAGLGEKLMGPVTAVIEKRRADLMPMLQGAQGQAAKAALRDDECVRKVASCCYPLLPVLIRLAVKEPTFISFVLDNREKVLGRLAAPA